jgi:excisionase family DNA binding protein
MTETVQKPLTIQEAAAFLGLKKSYIYNLVHYGKLAAFKPARKTLRFRQADLEAYIFRNRQAADFELADQADTILAGNK